MKKHYVICYDISDDRKRNKIDQLLKNKGMRVQKSVFECIITEAEFLKLKDRLVKYIDFDTDSIRYYFLCKHCVEMIETAGNTPTHEEKDLTII
ncbi:CRISPR-associated protein Cas2 [Flexistipes sinusarabici DSM 4947]|uniref:CRISPR-associated endoribonuclease Cas2 n=1 Tax=Flexistipes sinusarabici (strain ATCC 49648 / DSM 4947 / MAS 10) TaxID=717231 RepID=F8E953_FLESM|nr:CRISPR-associated endonuclease Cas2 [Flexistipes sinusarabici]AEI15255.1 CRISPR-associated protein Cas2 [Flexistipes sinusarabici DSM 4947]